MENALLVGLSRQMTLERQFDVVANNIANINTNGYKADHMLFEEYLTSAAHEDNFKAADRRISYVQDRGKYDYQHHCEVGSDNAEFVSDEVIDRFCLLGPPEAHQKKLRELEKAGVTQFNIYLMCGDEEQNLESWQREVLAGCLKQK